MTGLHEIAALQRKLASWLAEAGAAGVDELGMKALFAAALREFHHGGGAGGRLPGREARDRADGAA